MKLFTDQSVKNFTRAEHTDLVSVVNAKTKEKSRVNKDVVVAFAAAVAVLLICFGAAAMHPSYPAVESHPFVASAGPAGAASAAAFGGSPVVLRVNGQPVTQKEFEAYLSAAPEQARTFAASAEGRRLIADQLVRMKALEQKGIELGAEKDPEVSSQVALMHANAAAGYALQKLVGEPTETELRASYDKEKASSGEKQVRHLLVSCGDSPIPPRSGGQVPCEQALAKAEQIRAAIHSRDDFERAARAMSDDTNSGAEGGLLGALRPGSMPPEVEQVVSALKPDEVSKPVRTQFGFHLFTVSAPEPEPFARMRPALVQKWKQEKVKQVLADAAKNAKVDYDPKYFGPAPSAMPAPSPAIGGGKRAS